MPAPLHPLTFALGSALLVASPSHCPAPAAVDARVREILGLGPAAVLAERATIQREGSALRVTVRDADQQVLGERLLQADGNCEELSSAVAVVLATWISDVHPEYVGALPASEPAPVPVPPPVDTRAGDAPQLPTRRATPARNLQVDGALGANLSSAEAAPFAALGVRFLPKSWGVGVGAQAELTAPRNLRLGDGSVRFLRWPLSLGPILHLPIGTKALDVQAGAALGWLHVAGVDFTAPASRDALVGGVFAAARFTVGAGRIAPFAEVSSTFWPSSTAYVRGAEQASVSVRLPRLELYGSLGATLRGW